MGRPACASLGALVLAAGATGQQPALFQAYDLPLELDVAQQIESSTGARLPPVDARHLTPSPNTLVRDLDGDGHLDATWLNNGLWLLHGHGDGRFDGTFHSTALSPWPDPPGKWADVSGDGILDAVFLYPDSVESFLDQGDGSFLSTGAVDAAGENDFSTWAWDIGDVDGDGVADIVAEDYASYPPSRLVVLHGQGSATFGTPVVLAVPDPDPFRFVLADVNNDSLLDIVDNYQVSTSVSKLRTWVQAADGTFASTTPTTTESSSGIAVRDMTGDGLVDVISQENSPVGSVAIREGIGDGTFPGPPLGVPGAGIPAFFADMDQDGLVDVIADVPGKDHGTSVFLARPDGSFKPPVTTRHWGNPVGTGDFDGDGVIDLFTPQSVLLGRPDGHFVAPRSFDLGSAPGYPPELPTELALGDFNSDGISDAWDFSFVTLSEPGGAWGTPIELESAGPVEVVAAGDVDGDGAVDVIAGIGVTATFVQVWFGDGLGAFDESFTLLMGPIAGNSCLGMGQFGGGPLPDLVAAGSGELHVRVGLGNLAFAGSAVTSLPGGGTKPWFLVHDLDLDGLDDIILSQPDVHVLRCAGHGLFEQPRSLETSADAMCLADLDLDGDVDLISSSNQTVTTFFNDGYASLQIAPLPPVESQRVVRGIAIADVDDDGLPDLALGHYYGWSLHLGTPGGGWRPDPVDMFDLGCRGLGLRFEDLNADGHLDLLAAGRGSDGYYEATGEYGLSLSLNQLGPWSDVGFALGGANGEACLWPTGTLRADTPVSLVLRDAPALAPTYLVMGLSKQFAPFKGGVLVPEPLFVSSMGQTSATGDVTLQFVMPLGIPTGTTLCCQCWCKDDSGPAGFVASNAVTGEVP
jgi:hypothetical protein